MEEARQFPYRLKSVRVSLPTRMKILFIDPPSHRYGLNTAFAHLAPVIRKAGHKFDFIDMNNKEVSDLKNKIMLSKPDAIGFSIQSLTYYVTMKIVEDIKKYYGKPIIVGGPQTFIEQENILKNYPAVDIVVIGEGEITIVELLDALKNKKNLDGIKGIIYNNRKNPPREFIKDLDSLPYPDYSIYDSVQYSTISGKVEYSLFTSRGCPYNCSFCTTPAYYNRRWRARKPKNCIAELKYTLNQNPLIKHFMIRDENFTVNREQAKKFCRLLIKENLGLTWDCIFRADGFDEELARLMEKAGCIKVQVGIESLDPEVFKKIDKGEDLDTVIKGIKLLRKVTNMKIFGYFVLGLPGDTFEKTIRTYKLGKKLNLDYTEWQHLMVFPKTGVAEQAKKINGKIIKDYRDQINPYDVGFETPEFTKEEREKAYNIIRTKEKAYRFDLDKNNVYNLIYNLKLILKYDIINLPSHLYKIAVKGFEILLKGREKVIGGVEVKE